MKNVPVTFQRLVNKIYVEWRDTCWHLDDMLCYAIPGKIIFSACGMP